MDTMRIIQQVNSNTSSNLISTQFWDICVAVDCGRSLRRSNPCESNPCENGATCDDQDGQYRCICLPGYKGKHCRKGKLLITRLIRCRIVPLDVDECLEDKHDCQSPAFCKNTIGSYKCKCKKDGFELSDDGRSCVDINECRTGKHNCIKPATCINTYGSFRCDCSLKGYELDVNRCIDVNECITGQHECRRPAECKNAPGAYTCMCTGEHRRPTPDNRGCECDSDDYRMTDSGNCERISLITRARPTTIATDSEFTCNCLPPDEPSPHHLQPNQTIYSCNSVVKINCSGHCYGDPVIASCRSDGSWSEKFPVCYGKEKCHFCGHRVPPASDRIILPKKTDPGDWPWQVLLKFKNTRKQVLCGGSLIHPEWILTAAHCIYPTRWYSFAPSDIRVFLGLHDTGTAGRRCAEVEKRGVVEVIKHPKYRKRYDHDFDVALLRLSSPVNCSRYIRPICLNNSTDFEREYMTSGKNCTIAGWGKTDLRLDTRPTKSPGFEPELLSNSKKLLKVRMPLVNHSTCYKGFRSKRVDVTLTDQMICAGYNVRKEDQQVPDICNNDSGGPLVCHVKNQGRWVQVGLASFGHRKCGLTYAVFARISAVHKWICKMIQCDRESLMLSG